MQVNDTVRAVHTNPVTRVRRAFFATVLSIQPSVPEDDGTNGEPTVTLGILTTKNGVPEFNRHPTVRHVSHDEVQMCATEYCYVEVLPSDGSPVHLQRLNMDNVDVAPLDALEAPDTVGTVIYTNPNNGLEVIHAEEDLFTVYFESEDHRFTDAFSAKTFVDAKPAPTGAAGIQQMLADNPGWDHTGVSTGRISGSPMHLVAARIAKEQAAKQKEKEDAGSAVQKIAENLPPDSPDALAAL
jgi:hypothetical protein